MIHLRAGALWMRTQRNETDDAGVVHTHITETHLGDCWGDTHFVTGGLVPREDPPPLADGGWPPEDPEGR
jgi:hypothetical protein